MTTPEAGRGLYRGLTEGARAEDDAWRRAAEICGQIACIERVRGEALDTRVGAAADRRIRQLRHEIAEIIQAIGLVPAPCEPEAVGPEPAVLDILRKVDWGEAYWSKHTFLVTNDPDHVYRIVDATTLIDIADDTRWQVDFENRQIYCIGEDCIRDMPLTMARTATTAPAAPPDDSLPALKALVEKLEPLLAPGVKVRSYYRGMINFLGPKGNHEFWDVFSLKEHLNAWGNELALKDWLREHGWLLEEAPPLTAGEVQAIAEAAVETVEATKATLQEMASAPLTHDGQPEEAMTVEEAADIAEERIGKFLAGIDECVHRPNGFVEPVTNLPPRPECPPVQVEQDQPDTPWRGISPWHMNALLDHVRQNWMVVEKGCAWRKTNMAGLAAEIQVQVPNDTVFVFPLNRDQRPEDHSTYEKIEQMLDQFGVWRKGEAAQ